MAISYNKLWKLLIDKRMKRIDLKKMASLSTTTLAKLGKEEVVSMEVMQCICKVLNCDIGNVMEFEPDEE